MLGVLAFDHIGQRDPARSADDVEDVDTESISYETMNPTSTSRTMASQS
ncbi:hypothetical protein ACCUM_2290 [Candidatus Accumulibacter phosphatis]|uniref:Uncharacterized protein n=1 Tax=Candidatus Accumulibacter phosphatis TaxID=327160 RepID=A0A5S4ERQ4_9PROT|nr:hypothetical protein ACCUM_2290 [Candidatus Accumulibacter phosphatis]